MAKGRPTENSLVNAEKGGNLFQIRPLSSAAKRQKKSDMSQDVCIRTYERIASLSDSAHFGPERKTGAQVKEGNRKKEEIRGFYRCRKESNTKVVCGRSRKDLGYHLGKHRRKGSLKSTSNWINDVEKILHVQKSYKLEHGQKKAKVVT